MAKDTIEKDVILKRINGIQQELFELRKLGKLRFNEFKNGDGFKLAQYHLHRALEGVFNISSHIISRIPGAQATQYKEIATQLGVFNVIDKKFANTRLVEMAKYRNRLVHFYAEITEKEIYDILRNNLKDFDIFLKAIKNLLANPKKFNLSVE